MSLKHDNVTSLDNTEDELWIKDVWNANDVGLKPDTVHSAYYLSFKKITTEWLKIAAKKFVRIQAATRSFSTCRTYIRSINYFDEYLNSIDAAFISSKICRSHIVGFIHYLSNKKLGPVSRSITLINLRTFHQIGTQEGWLDWPNKPIVFASDVPKLVNKAPKFISDDVLAQLKKHLHCLSEWMQYFITILMETGRRVSEACLLEFNCLEKDHDGDWMLRVHEKKLNKVRLIPISQQCVDAVKAQQRYLKNNSEDSPLLFPGRVFSKSPNVTAPPINRALNKLAKDKNIIDANGEIWRFCTHQFRHTIGTQMINTGVSQVMVQKYLGHESPEMTARYAHIHDSTMKKAFVDYQEKMIDVQGKQLSEEHINAKWLKKNITTQSLPNGLCALPLTQKKCPHANACLTCGHFRTSRRFLENHKSQLDETTKVIENAKINGWQRIVEMNTEVACNLQSIIQRLEGKND